MTGRERRRPASRIIANLDCEGELARAHAAVRRERGEEAPEPADPRFALPADVRRRIAAFGTLLRALAREGDVLWTPARVDPTRIVPVDGLPSPRLERGALCRLEPAGATAAWGETPTVTALRAADPPAAEPPAANAREAGSILAAIWGAEPSSPDGARRANHRAFCLEAAKELGHALPGARLIQDLDELREHLGAGGAVYASTERWVLKAPFSAAGRARVLGAGAEVDVPSRRRAERLLALHGELLFEPWVERVADFGCIAMVSEEGTRVLGFHRQAVTAAGQFRGVVLKAGSDEAPGLRPDEREAFREAAELVGRRARSVGYRGPLSIDGWRFRDRTGRRRFHPIGEVNARMSFGFVARALVERLLEPCGLVEGRLVSLRFGTAEEMREEDRRARVIRLLDGCEKDPGCAWLAEDGPEEPPGNR